MYISIFVKKKLSFNKKNWTPQLKFFFERAYLHWTLQFKFLCWKDPNSLNSPVFFERTQLHFTELPSWSFFLEGLHFTELPSSKFHLEVLHFTELPSWSFFGSTSLHWTPQLKFFWNDFTSLNSPVEVFLEWFHFTELPSWSFFGMISLNWTPQFKVLFGRAPLH